MTSWSNVLWIFSRWPPACNRVDSLRFFRLIPLRMFPASKTDSVGSFRRAASMILSSSLRMDDESLAGSSWLLRRFFLVEWCSLLNPLAYSFSHIYLFINKIVSLLREGLYLKRVNFAEKLFIPLAKRFCYLERVISADTLFWLLDTFYIYLYMPLVLGCRGLPGPYRPFADAIKTHSSSANPDVSGLVLG